MSSRYLNEHQLEGLRKAGEIMVPGDEDLPSFSSVELADQVDRALPYMRDSDREDFAALMTLFGYLPKFLIRFILFVSTLDWTFPGKAGATLRTLRIGLKGVVMSLYYSDFTEDNRIHRTIGWEAGIRTDESDLDPDQARSKEAYEQATKDSGGG